MLTVLVTGPTVTHDSPFSSLAAAITVASTHFVYPRPEGWPGWVGLGGLVEHQDGIPRERSPISALTRLDVE